jgi:hypothetical protein
VAEVGHADAATEVENVAPVDGEKVRAKGALDHKVGVSAVGARNQFGVTLSPDSGGVTPPDGNVAHRAPPR